MLSCFQFFRKSLACDVVVMVRLKTVDTDGSTSTFAGPTLLSELGLREAITDLLIGRRRRGRLTFNVLRERRRKVIQVYDPSLRSQDKVNRTMEMGEDMETCNNCNYYLVSLIGTYGMTVEDQ